MSRFSELVMEHFMEPRNCGTLEAPDAVGVAGSPGQGPYFVIQLAIQNDRVTAVRFQSHSCGATVASGSALTELVSGSTLETCQKIVAQDVIDALDGLPPDKRHCAGFAVHALSEALKKCSDNPGHSIS